MYGQYRQDDMELTMYNSFSINLAASRHAAVLLPTVHVNNQLLLLRSCYVPYSGYISAV